jgi:hypothetical protein
VVRVVPNVGFPWKLSSIGTSRSEIGDPPPHTSIGDADSVLLSCPTVRAYSMGLDTCCYVHICMSQIKDEMSVKKEEWLIVRKGAGSAHLNTS